MTMNLRALKFTKAGGISHHIKIHDSRKYEFNKFLSSQSSIHSEEDIA